jgi:uncharacterized BrkB/YihY/UPF0761 family membrane protein
MLVLAVEDVRSWLGAAATVVAVGALLTGAWGVRMELHRTLSDVWEVPHPDTQTPWPQVRARFLSRETALAAAFILLVSLVFSAGSAASKPLLANLVPAAPWLIRTTEIAFSLTVFTAVFALIYRTLTNVSLTWHGTLAGAACASVVFAAGTFPTGLILRQTGFATLYGAAGSFMIVLGWTYYSAQIFHFGAEFMRVFAIHRGWRPARRVPEVARLSRVLLRPVFDCDRDLHTEPDLETREEEAARGGACLTAGEDDQPQLWLVAAFGGLSWWHGRTRKRAESDRD